MAQRISPYPLDTLSCQLAGFGVTSMLRHLREIDDRQGQIRLAGIFAQQSTPGQKIALLPQIPNSMFDRRRISKIFATED